MVAVPVPHLITAQSGPLFYLEKIILNHIVMIESWFRQKWKEHPAPLTSSVDLRHSGYKLAPVDTNLFPAGFNNLNPDSLPLCVQAIQSVMSDYFPKCRRLLLLPEAHTRNLFYYQSLNVLKNVLIKAGFEVRIGSLDPEVTAPSTIELADSEYLTLEPLIRVQDRLALENYSPCMIILNNDLSGGIPDILQHLKQPIGPSEKLGWYLRLKSEHFSCYDEIAEEFAQLIGIDPWLINPFFTAVEGVDFMAQEGLDKIYTQASHMLANIQDKYLSYGIEHKPFIVIKADNGTYGMNVMMVSDLEELKQLNRKQRTKMSTGKNNRKVERVLIQEGVYTFETMPDGAVAEPVVYMIGSFVVGGFYRIHKGRGKNENLNAPGMQFEPLAFAEPCNMPSNDLAAADCPNRFYAYGVIARLAALAAAKEISHLKEGQ